MPLNRFNHSERVEAVGNPAMRAAEASQNTTALAEGTIKKIKEWADLVSLTNVGFREVATHVAKSGELIGEISAASREQARGIEQISAATGKMEEVVESNAANTEECASASEEMNLRAQQLKEFVSDYKYRPEQVIPFETEVSDS